MVKLFNPEDITTVTQLRNELAKYLNKANREPVAIQRNGIITHVLINLDQYRKLVEGKREG